MICFIINDSGGYEVWNNMDVIKDNRTFSTLYSIHIDDSGKYGNGTWDGWARERPWCTGTGTKNDPYIIENVTINGRGNGDCILIGNSTKYFIVRNCTLFNAKNAGNCAGIRLDNVANGQLINNNCSKNAVNGITLMNGCMNNTVFKNIVNNNYQGICLDTNCNNNTIANNSACNNGFIEICLNTNCNYNKILNNNASNSRLQRIGINLWNGCEYNNISNNIVFNYTDWGIGIQSSSNNYISRNIVSNITYRVFYSGYGIYVQYSYSNTIFNNTIRNSVVNFGMYLTGSSGNLIYKNYFIKNKIQAKNDESNQWNNTAIGNYWDNYTGVDNNFDGIGDTPYSISNGLTYDNYPLMNPVDI